jgi:hypothetical protein
MNKLKDDPEGYKKSIGLNDIREKKDILLWKEHLSVQL